MFFLGDSETNSTTETYGTHHPGLMLAVSFRREDNFNFTSNAPSGADPAIVDSNAGSYGDDLIFPNGDRVLYKIAGGISFQVVQD